MDDQGHKIPVNHDAKLDTIDYLKWLEELNGERVISKAKQDMEKSQKKAATDLDERQIYGVRAICKADLRNIFPMSWLQKLIRCVIER